MVVVGGWWSHHRIASTNPAPSKHHGSAWRWVRGWWVMVMVVGAWVVGDGDGGGGRVGGGHTIGLQHQSTSNKHKVYFEAKLILRSGVLPSARKGTT